MITTNPRASKDFTPPSQNEINSMKKALSGEESAISAYKKVLKKIDDDPESHRLTEFLSDHQIAAAYWAKEMEQERIKVDPSPGPWGTFVNAVVESAKILGNTPALKALKEGEEHGLKQYQDFLEDEDCSEEHKRYVREVLIPNQERHIASVTAMMKLQ